MRFRGVLHAKGVHILTRAFLPTLEKFGRTAQLLLSPTEVHLVQTALNTDGPHVTARFDAATLFVVDPPGSYRVASRHHDLIAVSLDVALLAKALRSAAAAAAQAGLGGADDPGAGVVDVRLTQRVVPAAAAAGGGGGDDGSGGNGNYAAAAAARPFLAFGVRGTLSQDLPVSRPFAPAEVDRLAGAKDVSELCDYYVDLADCGVRWLQGLCERVRCVAQAGVGSVATAASGDLHVSTAAGGAGGGGGGGGGQGGRPVLGTLVQGLRVLPANTEFDPALLDRSLPAEQQLDALVRAGAARRCALQLRHLGRVLAAASLSAPAQVLLGLPAGGGYAHVMFVYRNPRGAEPFDDSLGLSFKLPVRQDDDDIEGGSEGEEEEGEAAGGDAYAFDARGGDGDGGDGGGGRGARAAAAMAMA